MYKLITFPNDILKQKTIEVKEIDKNIKKIAVEMKKIMKKHHGVGLAANQIGLNLSLFIVEEKNKILTFINPKIIKFEGKKVRELIKNKDYKSLAYYVLGDVLTTAKLYELWTNYLRYFLNENKQP